MDKVVEDEEELEWEEWKPGQSTFAAHMVRSAGDVPNLYIYIHTSCLASLLAGEHNLDTRCMCGVASRHPSLPPSFDTANF